MKKLLLLLLGPMLGAVFFTVEQFNELNAQVQELKEQVLYLENLQNPLLDEIFYVESENFSITFTIENGYSQSMTVCELDSGECETSSEKTKEQIDPYYQTDRQQFIDGLENYLDMIEHLRDVFS